MMVGNVFLCFAAAMAVIKADDPIIDAKGTRFEKHTGLRLLTYFDEFKNVSKIKCCAACARSESCNSVTYIKADKECRLTTVERQSVLNDAVSDANADVWSSDLQAASAWGSLVFRGTRGNGFDPYDAFNNGGAGITDTDPECLILEDNGCTLHYRSPAVDAWGTMGVSQVRYSYYKGGYEVAYILFDGTGSDSTSWFHPDKIVESSWPDMVEQTSFQSFSAAGYHRRFVTHVSVSGCGLTSYGMAVTQSAADQFGCAYDVYPTYPQYSYSVLTTAGTDANHANDFDLADLITIQIQTT